MDFQVVVVSPSSSKVISMMVVRGSLLRDRGQAALQNQKFCTHIKEDIYRYLLVVFFLYVVYGKVHINVCG